MTGMTAWRLPTGGLGLEVGAGGAGPAPPACRLAAHWSLLAAPPGRRRQPPSSHPRALLPQIPAHLSLSRPGSCASSLSDATSAAAADALELAPSFSGSLPSGASSASSGSPSHAASSSLRRPAAALWGEAGLAAPAPSSRAGEAARAAELLQASGSAAALEPARTPARRQLFGATPSTTSAAADGGPASSGGLFGVPAGGGRPLSPASLFSAPAGTLTAGGLGPADAASPTKAPSPRELLAALTATLTAQQEQARQAGGVRAVPAPAPRAPAAAGMACAVCHMMFADAGAFRAHCASREHALAVVQHGTAAGAHPPTPAAGELGGRAAAAAGRRTVTCRRTAPLAAWARRACLLQPASAPSCLPSDPWPGCYCCDAGLGAAAMPSLLVLAQTPVFNQLPRMQAGAASPAHGPAASSSAAAAAAAATSAAATALHMRQLGPPMGDASVLLLSGGVPKPAAPSPPAFSSYTPNLTPCCNQVGCGGPRFCQSRAPTKDGGQPYQRAPPQTHARGGPHNPRHLTRPTHPPACAHPVQLLDPHLDAQCLALLRTLRQLDGAERQGAGAGVGLGFSSADDLPDLPDPGLLLGGKPQRRLVGGLREVRGAAACAACACLHPCACGRHATSCTAPLLHGWLTHACAPPKTAAPGAQGGAPRPRAGGGGRCRHSGAQPGGPRPRARHAGGCSAQERAPRVALGSEGWLSHQRPRPVPRPARLTHTLAPLSPDPLPAAGRRHFGHCCAGGGARRARHLRAHPRGPGVRVRPQQAHVG